MTIGVRHIVWAGGEHDFSIAATGRVLALEANRAAQVGGAHAGIAAIYQRLLTGTWGRDDVREVIRQGLIGGGQSAEAANALVTANVDENPHGMAPSVLVAIAVVEAYLVGVPDDEIVKKNAAAAEQTSPTSSTNPLSPGSSDG